MPCLKIITNIPKAKIPARFVDEAIPVLAACVKKEPEKFFCTIEGDTPICFQCDSKTPAVVASLISIGNLGKKENKEISQAISHFIEQQIGVPPSRCFISFHDMKADDIGIKGTTVPFL